MPQTSYYFMVSVGNKSERSLAEVLWLKISHAAIVKLLVRTLVLSETQLGSWRRESSSKFIHMIFAG